MTEDSKGKSVQRYADAAMYPAAEMTSMEPKVHLLWMTPDPLGAVAAMARMYEGKPTYRLSDITDDERKKYWNAMFETHLTAPLEAVKLHFFIEGVDRSFTHQMVRQRTAVYAQESLRFAVKEDLAKEVPFPPSFGDPRVSRSASKKNDLEDVWTSAVETVDQAYKFLIANGVPAEDARGLMPHAVLTRLNYVTDLRNLREHAGNRLCTQAQFHWRKAFMGIREAIRNNGKIDVTEQGDVKTQFIDGEVPSWQFELIADTMFQPQCYLQGHCPFNADFDRGCTIRPRVEQFAANGIPSKDWGNHDEFGDLAIDEAEWAEDPQAAWLK